MIQIIEFLLSTIFSLFTTCVCSQYMLEPEQIPGCTSELQPHFVSPETPHPGFVGKQPGVFLSLSFIILEPSILNLASTNPLVYCICSISGTCKDLGDMSDLQQNMELKQNGGEIGINGGISGQSSQLAYAPPTEILRNQGLFWSTCLCARRPFEQS